MTSIGMVINTNKTGLIVFSRDGGQSMELSNEIRSKKRIKALKFYLTSTLK